MLLQLDLDVDGKIIYLLTCQISANRIKWEFQSYKTYFNDRVEWGEMPPTVFPKITTRKSQDTFLL